MTLLFIKKVGKPMERIPILFVKSTLATDSFQEWEAKHDKAMY
jgi:hypothetical protein